MEIEEIDNQDPFIDKTNWKEIVTRIANGDYDVDHDDDFVPDIKPIKMPDDNDDEGFSPFDKPLPNGYDNDNPRFQAPKTLKSVFCSYRGRLTVYDISGKKVEELSGMLTLDKYNKIEELSDPDTTEFDGYEDYKRIAAELKEKDGGARVFGYDPHPPSHIPPVKPTSPPVTHKRVVGNTTIKVNQPGPPPSSGSFIGQICCIESPINSSVYVWTGGNGWNLISSRNICTQNSGI